MTKIIHSTSDEPVQIYTEVQDVESQIHVEIQDEKPQINIGIEKAGPQGEPGKDGKVWLPVVDEDSNLTWVQDSGETVPDSFNIKGEPGVVDYNQVKAITTYTHEQAQATDYWDIQHNLGYYPSVSITTYGGTTIIGAIKYINTNYLTVEFTVEVAGYAHLS